MTTTPVDIPATLTSLTTLVAAVGALIVSVVATWRTSKAKRAAEEAKAVVEGAKVIVEESKKEIVATKEGVFELGKALDGRLKQLLDATERSARAAGVAEGRQEERADAAAGRPPVIEKPEVKP